MSEKLVPIAVVIFTSREVSRKAIEVSHAAFESFGGRFHLGSLRHLPHVVAHKWAMPAERLEVFRGSVSELANQTAPFDVKLEGLISDRDLRVRWKAEVGRDPLWKLHSALVIRVGNLLQHQFPPRGVETFFGEVPSTAAQKLAYDNHGDPGASPWQPEEPYCPHILLSRLRKRKRVRAVLRILRVERMTFQVSAIHITELGPNGTCPGSLERFELCGK